MQLTHKDTGTHTHTKVNVKVRNSYTTGQIPSNQKKKHAVIEEIN